MQDSSTTNIVSTTSAAWQRTHGGSYNFEWLQICSLQLYYALEIKPCGSDFRIRDMEAESHE